MNIHEKRQKFAANLLVIIYCGISLGIGLVLGGIGTEIELKETKKHCDCRSLDKTKLIMENKPIELEDQIKNALRMRGFGETQLVNNRGLIGATIEETALAVLRVVARK